MSVKFSLKSFINVLIWLSILTSSFDIVLVFDVAGFTVRISQIFMLIVMVSFVIEVMRKGKFPIPVGYSWLCLCVILNTLFIFNSKSFGNAVGYAVWFIFDVFEIIVILYYFRRTETLESVTRKYVNCFTIMAVVGLVQWGLQFLGIYFYVTQQNAMHRCNGFSYEPSYYSTYLLMGWCICAYLLENSNYSALPKRKLIIYTIIITLALILSTSRMGWIMMVVYIICRSLSVIFRNNRGVMSIWKFLMILFLVVIVVGLFYVVYGIAAGDPKILKYAEGLGIGGTASHSTNNRVKGLKETFQLFKESPFIGYSLGGVDPEIWYNRGYTTFSNGAGISVFVEMLAAFGIVGFLFWGRYLYILLYKKYKFFKKYLNKANREVLAAFLIALAMEFIILQFNQNVLRPYVWIHIALVSVIYYYESIKYKQSL